MSSRKLWLLAALIALFACSDAAAETLINNDVLRLTFEIFQRIHDDFFFKTVHGLFKGEGQGFRLCPGLEGGRQVIGMNGPFIAEDDGPLKAVLKLPDISGPVVFHHHVNGRGGDAFDLL